MKIEQAFFLFLLVPLLPIWIWSILRFPARSRSRRIWISLFRGTAILALILAASEPQLRLPDRTLHVAMVIDPSAAISDLERTRIREEVMQNLPSQMRLSLDASTLGEDGREEDETTTRDSLSERIRAAMQRLPEGKSRALWIWTDGRDQSPEVSTAIAEAREKDVRVYVSSAGDRPLVDALSIEAMDAPRLVRAGEEGDVSLTIHGQPSTQVRVVMRLKGEEISTRTVDLGSSERVRVNLPVRFPDLPQILELQASVQADGPATAEGDPRSENDRFQALVEVVPKARVRIVRNADDLQRLGQNTVLTETLSRAGFDPEVVTPEQMPTDAQTFDRDSLVIFNELDEDQLSEAQQRALRSWVEDQGGGLLVVTGPQPIKRTPTILREIEPLEPPPALPEQSPLELVIVIDRSSSMSGFAMEQARRAGVAAVRSLRPDSRVGVVAFSSAADRVVAPQPMSQAPQVMSFIAGIQASGGTNIAAAIQAANRVMSSDPHYRHHVILISDGESEARAAIAAAMALSGRGVTMSTITIGSYSDLLAEIARLGHGRYHTTSASGLVGLVVSESQSRRAPAQTQRSFVPRAAETWDAVSPNTFVGSNGFSGHAMSSLRDGARAIFTGTEEKPLLAEWHRGRGRVAQFTSSIDGPWASSMRGFDGFRPFIVHLSRALMRSRTIDPPSIELRFDPNNARLADLVVRSPFAMSSPEPVVRLANGPHSFAPLSFRVRAPGVFQSTIDISSENMDNILVDARMPWDPFPTVARGIEAKPALDRLFGTDSLGLAHLSELAGNPIAESRVALEQALEARWSFVAMRIPLLFLALALYLLSLFVLRWPENHTDAALLSRPSRTSMPFIHQAAVPPSSKSAGSKAAEKSRSKKRNDAA